MASASSNSSASFSASAFSREVLNDIPPPPEVAALIPSFDECGPQHCDASFESCCGPADNGQCEGPQAHALSACGRCASFFRRDRLHALPCGHALCRDCVDAAVDDIAASVQSNFGEIDWRLREVEELCETLPLREAAIGPLLPKCRPSDAVAHRCELHEAVVTRGFRQNPYPHRLEQPARARPESPLPLQLARARDLYLEALMYGGFTCCGINMQLGRFQHCMSSRKPGHEEENAKVLTVQKYWLVAMWMRTFVQQRLVCPWPDCRLFVPCEMVSGFPDNTRVHCAMCSGNSGFLTSRVTHVDQHEWPGLLAGTDILSPAL